MTKPETPEQRLLARLVRVLDKLLEYEAGYFANLPETKERGERIVAELQEIAKELEGDLPKGRDKE